MAKRKKRDAKGIISRYAEAAARGENPEPPVFLRPAADETDEEFADRLYDATVAMVNRSKSQRHHRSNSQKPKSS